MLNPMIFKSILCIGCASSLVLSLCACSKKYVKLDDVELLNFQEPASGEEIAVFKLEHMNESLGEVRIKLFEDAVPQAVENFKRLVETDYYDGCVFFHVSPEEYVMSGDASGLGTGGTAAVETPCLPSNQLYNFTGAIGFTSQNNYCDSRFYIVTGSTVTADDFVSYAMQDTQKYFPQNVKSVYMDVGGQPGLDNGSNMVFGQIFEQDMEIINKICSVELTQDYRPEKAVIITSAEIVEYDGEQLG